MRSKRVMQHSERVIVREINEERGSEKGNDKREI